MEVACESTVWILFGLRLFIMTAVAGPSHRHSNDKTTENQFNTFNNDNNNKISNDNNNKLTNRMK